MKFKDILKYRSIWMGIAIISIVFLHATVYFPDCSLYSNMFFKFMHKFGYGAVDIFVFASGLGCYYSLSGREENFSGDKSELISGTAGSFIKDRMIKNLPPFYIYLTIWTICHKFFESTFSFKTLIGNIFLVQWYTGNENIINWYLFAMWIWYFSAPFIYSLVKRHNSLPEFLMLLCCSFLITVPFLSVNERWIDYLIMMSRFPVFYIGMAFADLSKKKEELSKRNAGILILIFLICVALWRIFVVENFQKGAFNAGYGFYVFAGIVPGLCVLISLVCIFFEKRKCGKTILRLFAFIGRHTFEIFLSHLLIFDIVYRLDSKKILISDRNSVFISVLALILIIPLSSLINFLSKVISGKLLRNKNRKISKKSCRIF